MSLFATLARHARRHLGHVALRGAHGDLTYAALLEAVHRLAASLDGRCVGLLADNGPAWLIVDLAAQLRGIPCVPLPTFFSPAQLAHVVRDAGIDLLFADREVHGLLPASTATPIEIAGVRFTVQRARVTPRIQAGTAKVTYTSGTTGEPKGVRLGADTLTRVTVSLATACGARPDDRMLSLLPLSTLLENLGALAALHAGASVTLLPASRTGLSGSCGLDPATLSATLHATRPTTLILVPQLLQALVELAEADPRLSASLRYVAVGGAPVGTSLLTRAARAGLPVFQGYGLSEASSVVTLNRPGANLVGSVGRPLPHARVRIAADGEVLVGGALCDGYLGTPSAARDGWWPTGDLGHLDDAGYLHITGRKSARFVTAFGRNVSPEWVEKELLSRAPVVQAVVSGEARPYNVALLVPRPGTASAQLLAGVQAANRRLPDYARVGRFTVADEPFSLANGELTGSGRPRRAAILDRYAARLDSLYGESRA